MFAFHIAKVNLLEKEKKLSAIGESETAVTQKISDVDKDNF